MLFSRSLNKLLGIDAGFTQQGVLITDAGFRRLNIPADRRFAFRQDMLNRLRAIPGVDAAGETIAAPLAGASASNNVWLEGSGSEQGLNTWLNWVGVDYFKTLQTPIVAGRDISDRDDMKTAPVAVINETLARKLFNGANPIGRRFWKEKTPNDPETLYEVIGVVKDTKYGDLREEFRPIAFFSIGQDPNPGAGAEILIRSKLSQADITAAIKKTLAEINPSISISFYGFQKMIEESLLRDRLMATLSGFFGVLALLLAAIGLYGILSYGVASRTKEIGIRMALGAQRREVLGLILREAVLLVVVGVAVGLPIVFGLTRFATTLLFGLKPTDPISLGLAGLVLFVVALSAAYLPARRATKVDPLVALRYE
jgi:predicted permease